MAHMHVELQTVGRSLPLLGDSETTLEPPKSLNFIVARKLLTEKAHSFSKICLQQVTFQC